MKFLFIISLLFSGALYAQDSLIISSHRLIQNELNACMKSKNQLVFLDSLIDQAINERTPAKGNLRRFYKIKNEKLVIFHIDAAWICRLRGDFDLAHEYSDNGESYLDSLKKYDLHDDELKNVYGAYNNIQRQICYDTYQNDTSLFYARDCAKFFPELSDEKIENDSISELNRIDSISGSSTPIDNHMGKIYLNDTLRFNPQFVLDSISSEFFKKIEWSLKSNLSYKSFPEGMRHLKYNQTDTIIIEINIYFDSTTVSKTCNLIYSNSHKLIRNYYLFYFNSMNFGLDLNYGESPQMFKRKHIKFYVPLVIKPETPNNFNKMDRFYVNDDHYFIEYEKAKPIKLH